MAARFSSSKCQDLLVFALEHLVERSPETRWRLTLAGDGDCLEAVQRQAIARGMQGSVDFMGNLDEPELIEWFRTLDLYVHASEGEALSTSMLQAMSMGLPIVASAVPGIVDLLEQPGMRLGVLTTANTSEAFADSIEALQSAPDLQARLGTACRNHVTSAYSHETMFERYNNLIQKARK
jgi:glycosyltransferase involved in cell wall biosynthesis